MALARPGLDTRTWESLAYALGESVVDPGHGVFVDVKLVPSGEEYTARVPSAYAGKGFGLYTKIHKDDSLQVSVPSGDPAHGCVVTGRFWNADDTPPQAAVDAPDDVLLVIESARNLSIVVAGGGFINLGDAQPPSGVPRDDRVLDELNKIKADFDAFKTAYDVHTHSYVPGTLPPTSSAPPLAAAPTAHTPATMASDTTKVK